MKNGTSGNRNGNRRTLTLGCALLLVTVLALSGVTILNLWLMPLASKVPDLRME